MVNNNGSHAGAASLNFRIFKVTSEDPEFPANTRGWQSQRFCVYPQELILQFPHKVRITQIKFLSHHHKIASKVELHAYTPPGFQNAPSHEYERLGHFSFNDNIQTNYQSREMKSVYVDTHCQYLKIMFHKCHNNMYNIFQQVGVVSITCIGEFMGGKRPLAIDNSHHYLKSEGLGEMEYKTEVVNYVKEKDIGGESPHNDNVDGNHDHILLDKIKALSAAKEEAALIEDYDEAKKLKHIIDNLQAAMSQLSQLIKQKKAAIEQEDFDTAKMLKIEIDDYRKRALSEIHSKDKHNKAMDGGMGDRKGSLPPLIMEKKLNDAKDEQDSERQHKSKMVIIKSNSVHFEEGHENKDKTENIENTDPINEETKVEGKKDKKKKKESKEAKNKVKKPHEEQIVPGAFHLVPINYAEVKDPTQGKEEKKHYEVEDLDTQKSIIAEPLFPVLTEHTCKQIFSAKWQNREIGLNHIIENMDEIIEKHPTTAYNAIMTIIANTVGDKVIQIGTKAVTLFGELLKRIEHGKLKGTGFKIESPQIENIVIHVFDKLAESNSKCREEGENIVMVLGKIADYSILLSHIASNSAYTNKKMLLSQKHQLARLTILKRLVEAKPRASTNISNVAKFASENTNRANNDVRNMAQGLLVECYKQYGYKKIEPQLRYLNDNAKPFLVKSIPELESYNPTENISPKVSPHIKSAKALGDVNDSMTTDGKNALNKSKSKKGLIKPSCQFCGKKDKAFHNESALDIHLVKECSMLTSCKHCAQMIEIPILCNHYLKECTESEKFNQCPKCKIAYMADREHTCEGELKQGYVRCGLCLKAVEDGDKGWRSHLIVNRCPKNIKG